MMTIRRNENWLPNIFSGIFDGAMEPKSTTMTAPLINIMEEEGEFKVELAAPGIKKENFDIRLDEDDNLLISMEKKEDEVEENKEKRYVRREFSCTAFRQKLILPDNVDRYKITASVENGVLYIGLPKMPEESSKKMQRSIEIL